MRLLVVEDDEFKSRQVREFLELTFPAAEVELSRSMTAGRSAIENAAPELILLDMSLPVFDYDGTASGFRHLSYGGIDIFELLDRKSLDIPVIVLTAFDRFGEGKDAKTLDEVDAELRKEFPHIYRGRVWYSAVSDGWRKELKALMERVLIDMQDTTRGEEH